MHAILGGNPGSKTTEFGHSCTLAIQHVFDAISLTPIVITVSFESGCEKFQDLERGIFVASGRFVVDERGLTSEYKVSQVGAGKVEEKKAQSGERSSPAG